MIIRMTQAIKLDLKKISSYNEDCPNGHGSDFMITYLTQFLWLKYFYSLDKIAKIQ